MLSSLHERFDKHLSQADRVHSLFVALNDEVFENRVAAVPLIGRLAMHNPAYAMPLLRKSLIQLLTELEYSSVTYVWSCHDVTCRLIHPLQAQPGRVHASSDAARQCHSTPDRTVLYLHTPRPSTEDERP